MAEFHGIFCRPFLPSVLIIEGMDGMGYGAGWGGVTGVEGSKNLPFGTPMSSHDAYTVASVSGGKPRSPLPNLCPPLVPLFQP